MQLVYGGDTPAFEWEMRKLDKTNHEYSCSVALVIELDPTLDMDKKTYVFTMSELTTTLSLLQDTVESLQGWAAVPVMRRPPRGNVALLPLHDDLTFTSGEKVVAEEVRAASLGGRLQCPLCLSEVVPKQMLQHMAGHIIEKKVRSIHV